ncbi:hypothetical protein [Pseudactinotalea sp. Z1748]|uniref:hypothetical protein n=1 Tax=Pseudactinotalea sp. Z1748 TaxID=3413027 RepID=UPI003C7D5507
MPDSTMDPLRPPVLPAHYPRTTTQLLLALPGVPFVHARERVARAWQALSELIEFLPAEQGRLREEFTNLRRQFEQFEIHARNWRIDGDQLRTVRRHPPPPWGEERVRGGAPVASQPAPRHHQDEPVFGFAATLVTVRDHLAVTAGALTGTTAGAKGTLHALYLAGRVVYGADAAFHLAAMFTAAVWDFERPGMPPLPSAAGRIELRSSPRAIPQTRWARYARLMFLQNRVELTTDAGHEVIGGSEPIAFLMHVAPPTPGTAEFLADPAQRYLPVDRFEDLGMIHFCSADGYSLGAVAVADWLAQPDVVVGQPEWTSLTPVELSVHSQVVWALEAGGFVAGAAVLGAPMRRGVAHPPLHPSIATRSRRSRAAANAADAPGSGPTGPDPHPGVHLLRPAPHLQPYLGQAASRKQAARRRTRNRLEVGPASPLQPWLQYLAAPAIVIAGLGLAFSDSAGRVVTVSMLVALLAVIEPWAWWAGQWLLDRDWRRMVAVYRPGGSPEATRQFAQRAELCFDGANIGVRGAGGHEAWLAAGSDQDLGVVTLVRLTHEGHTWAFAFADRLERWRLVLPAPEWAPGGDVEGLAAFARRAGLDLGDEHTPPRRLGEPTFSGRGADSVRRSRGPYTRAMLWPMWWALGVFLVTIAASGSTHQVFLLTVALLAGGPVVVRRVVRTWLQGRSRGSAPGRMKTTNRSRGR